MGFTEAKWVVDQIVSKLAVQPGNMRMFRAAPKGNAQVALQFTEPEPAYYRGGEAIAADVEGTVIRVSTEGYPQTPSDGALVVDNKDLGAYSDTDYVVDGLANGVPAYFSAFPYTSRGVYNESLDDANKATAAAGFNYTITFDNGGDGIPASFTYSDDAAGFTPAQASNMGSWANTELLDYFKPCLIKPSATEPEYFLNKNNYNLKEDGSASVLTGNDGDVMVQIKRLFYKVTKLTATQEIQLSIASYQVDNTYNSFNVVAGEDREFVYRGVYEAYTMSNQMRSVSNVVPTISQTRAQFRTAARARGSEYSQNDYYMLFLYQCMYIMLYGNRNSQVALGQGRTLLSNDGVSTGTLNDKPFCWGDQGGVNGVKFLGVEHFFGDRYEMVDGLTLVDHVYKITRDPAKYDDVGTSYETSINSAPTTNAFITSMKGVEDGIFLPDTVTGSEATYFCDFFSQNTATLIALFGGDWNEATLAGAFCLSLYHPVSYSDVSIGSRLCRK